METLKLKTLYLELTHACNQKCKHCYLDGGIHRKIEEMSTEAIKKMIREFKEQGGYSIIITGGEPLVRKDCFEILDYIEALDIVFTFASNSLLMNKKRLERLASYKNLKQYFTSVLGSNKEKHNAIAGNNSYEKVYESLKFFDEKGIATYVQATLVKDYIEDIEAIVRQLMQFRYCTVKITPVASLGTKKVEDTISDFIVEQKHFISFQEKIKQLQEQYSGRIEDGNIMSKSQIEACIQGYKDHPLYSLSYGFLAIRPDGTKSFSCNMNNPYVFGNAMNGLEIKLEENIYKYIDVLRKAEYYAQEKAEETQVQYTQFTLAVDEKHSKKDKKTYFIEVVAFHKKATALTRYAKKGQQILVQGKIVTDSFTNKEGEKVYSTKVLLEDFCFTGLVKSDQTLEQQDEQVVS